MSVERAWERTRGFTPARWRSIKVFQMPCAIFQRQPLLPDWPVMKDHPTLILGASSLAVLMVLYETAKNRRGIESEPFASIKIKQRNIAERTGLSKNVITRATQELEDRNFIKCEGQRKKYGEFGVNKYLLCNPTTGEPFETRPGFNLLYGHSVPYFDVPVCVVRESAENWSIAILSSSALKVYVSLSFLTNRLGSNKVQTSTSDLRTLSNLSTATLRKALRELETRGLIWTNGTKNEFTLCDPYTGEPVHEFTGNQRDDPARYSLSEARGGKRANLNTGAPEQIDTWIRSCLPVSAEAIRQGNGDLKIRCPFHDDQNPSCSVSLSKRCFNCFGCKENGTVTKLVMKLSGVSQAETIKGRALSVGVEIEYHDPDSKAEAIYQYLDANGKLLKEILRYPGKAFAQRRYGSVGWIWNVRGVNPILYNLFMLQWANTVCITEGEKDADRINSLRLPDSHGSSGTVEATTSGGAESWLDDLAESLIGKHVIVMPDADEHGMKYKEQIIASLEKRDIQYCIVTFEDCDAKDVSDFLDQGHTRDELIQRIEREWAKVEPPDLAERSGLTALDDSEIQL